MDTYQEFIFKSRYARWLEEEGRRETWEEAVKRYTDFWGNQIDGDTKADIYNAIHDMAVMPSMRSFWTAGEALRKNNVAGYNCAFIAVDHPRAFDEAMYVLMSGCGIGFSVEAKHISKLPVVAEEFFPSDTVIKVRDSRTGWCKAFKELITLLYSGQIPEIDYSSLRPAGARLRTMGGRSSGPEPLKHLFETTIGIFKVAAGRHLSTIECHDLMCKVGEIVVVGGVRRSALISLGDLGDNDHRYAKHGAWWEQNAQRALSNNSAVYYNRPDAETFFREFTSLIESKSGERGISNLGGSRKGAPERRKGELIQGYNPCHEIALRSAQMCNLSEVVCRSDDTVETLKEKVRIAAILGTLQSTLTDFKYLRKVWKDNCEEERLLGVSLTGIMDCKVLNGTSMQHGENVESVLAEMKEVAIKTNQEWADKLGIPHSTAITTGKPSGTVSQLVDASSGIHARYSKHYIRTVRQSNDDPITRFMKDAGVPHEPDEMAPERTTIFSFPIASPQNAKVASEEPAIKQLNMWKKFKTHWCEHSQSVTIYVRDDEWAGVAAWVFDNFDHCSGISFLPYDDNSYSQAPYQPITEVQYDDAFTSFPDINFDDLRFYEKEDNTEGAQTLACTGDKCELT